MAGAVMIQRVVGGVRMAKVLACCLACCILVCLFEGCLSTRRKVCECADNMRAIDAAVCGIWVERFPSNNTVVTIDDVWKDLKNRLKVSTTVPLLCPCGGRYSLQFTNDVGGSYTVTSREPNTWGDVWCSVHGSWSNVSRRAYPFAP
jgi:hypothetical protein